MLDSMCLASSHAGVSAEASRKWFLFFIFLPCCAQLPAPGAVAIALSPGGRFLETFQKLQPGGGEPNLIVWEVEASSELQQLALDLRPLQHSQFSLSCQKAIIWCRMRNYICKLNHRTQCEANKQAKSWYLELFPMSRLCGCLIMNSDCILSIVFLHCQGD